MNFLNICENSMCQYHKPVPESLDDNSQIVRVSNGVSYKEVQRFFYKINCRYGGFYLCESCHAAINLVMRIEAVSQHTNDTIHPTPRNIAFDRRLAHARKAKGLTISQLADRTNISQNVLGYYENGERAPGITTIKLLCEGLGCTASELMGF